MFSRLDSTAKESAYGRREAIFLGCVIVVAGILIASLATVSYVIAKQPTRCERLEAGWDSREATIEESVELTGEYFEFCLDP